MIKYNGVEISYKHQSISYKGKTIKFQSHKRVLRFKLLCTLLLSTQPLTRAELFNTIYHDDPNGGPLSDVNCISTMLIQLIPLIKSLGLELSIEGPYTMRVYYIKLLPEPLPPAIPLTIEPSHGRTHIGALSAPVEF